MNNPIRFVPHQLPLGRILVLIALTLLGFSSIAQQTNREWFTVKGYVKDLRTFSKFTGSPLIQDNLIHNRLNFRIIPSDKITVGIEARNRLFYGQTVQQNPFYADAVGLDNGTIDLSFNLFEQSGSFLNSTIDRFWVDYSDEKWEVRIGRQRINWGMNLAWNPNDIFNTYNITNFDYEERPGSDAIRIQRFLNGGMNSFELAYKPDTNPNGQVAAAYYRFNKWSYDIQFLAGQYLTDYVIGVGWAGNLKNAGFKGEASLFTDRKDVFRTNAVSASASVDYSFPKSIYTNVGILWSSNGIKNLGGLNTANTALLGGTLTAKNLMPTEWTFFLQTSGPITELITGSAAFIYLPGLLYGMPSISYSINNSWEIMVVDQVGFTKIGGAIKAPFNAMFVRTKFSF